MAAMNRVGMHLLDTNRYATLKARDTRSGGFFTGAAATGIYGGLVCGVRLPKRENCRCFNTPTRPGTLVIALTGATGPK